MLTGALSTQWIPMQALWEAMFDIINVRNMTGDEFLTVKLLSGKVGILDIQEYHVSEIP